MVNTSVYTLSTLLMRVLINCACVYIYVCMYTGAFPDNLVRQAAGILIGKCSDVCMKYIMMYMYIYLALCCYNHALNIHLPVCVYRRVLIHARSLRLGIPASVEGS